MSCRELFRLPEDVDISLTFGCKEPMSGQHLKLEGMGAFDAAVHCASVAAADRQQKVKKSYSTGNLDMNGSINPGMGMTRSTSNNTLSSVGGNTSHAAHAPGMTHGGQEDRRARYAGDHPGRSRTFHVRSTPATSAPTTPTPATPRTITPSAPSPTPPGFRNILGMLANGSGALAPPAPVAGGRAASQASPRLDGPQPSSRSLTTATTASGATTAAARATLKKERYSSRTITELTDVPEADETVAIGSLSGKFKLHLKAFSRKVARSLSFNKGTGAGPSHSSNGPSPHPSPRNPVTMVSPRSSFIIPAGNNSGNSVVPMTATASSSLMSATAGAY